MQLTGLVGVFLRSLFLIVATFIVANMSSMFLKYPCTHIEQFCSKCAMQVIYINEGFNFFSVLIARDI